MDKASMDLCYFKEDNNHSSSSSGSLPHMPFGEYWSSFSSMDDSYGDSSDLFNSSAVQLQGQFDELNVLMNPMDSNMEASCQDIFQQAQTGGFPHTPLQIYNEPSHPFSIASAGEMAITRAMLSLISSPPSSSNQTCQTKISSFQPYSSSKPPLYESPKNLHSQYMIKKAHNLLRGANIASSTLPTAYQMQHTVSERRRREKMNASFHSLWLQLPPGSKKDKTSVLCKTVSYVNALKAEICELEETNRVLEEANIKPNERIQVQINRHSEAQKIELVLRVGVQCDLARVVLHVLECIKAMKVLSLLSLDAIPDEQQLKLLATLNLAVEGSSWDEGSFKEAIAEAAYTALTAATPHN